jgi:hypothetical protein
VWSKEKGPHAFASVPYRARGDRRSIDRVMRLSVEIGRADHHTEHVS